MKRTKLLLSISILLSTIYTGSSFAQGSWSPLSGIDAPVQGMLEYQGSLYIGMLDFTPQDKIKKWDGTSMTGVGMGTNGAVTAFTIFNNDLYVAGGFTAAGGAPAANVAKWNGTNWTAIGSQLYNFSMNALTVYNGELYAGGFSFDTSMTNPAAFTIAKWNGTSWVSVGSGLQGGDIYALTVFNNELYAGGSFTSAGGTSTPLIAKWNGSTWSQVGSGAANGTTIYALKVHNGALYAAGNFSSIGGTASIGIASWNGSTWSAVGGAGTDKAAFALGSDGTNLYLGGAFNTVSGVTTNHIAKWDGTSWSALGSGVGIPNNSNEQVYSIAVYKNSVYAGGFFSQVNGVAGSYLAKWSNPSSIDDISSGNLEAAIYPNPVSGNTCIDVAIDRKTKLEIDIYDISGRKAATVFSGPIEKGRHEFNIGSLKNLTAGVYRASIKTDNDHVARMLLIK